MKSKKKILIYFTLSVIFILLVLSLFYLNNYLSKVVITKPFSVKINGLSKNQQEIVKIYGFSPTGKRQRLKRNPETDQWDYPIYSNFKDLYISLPDKLNELNQIKIITTNEEIILTNLKKQNSDTFFDISEQIRPFVLRTDILMSFFYWKEVRMLLSLLIAIIVFFISFKTISKLALKTNKLNKLLWSILISLLVGHILFFVFIGCYLISSGIIIYMILGILFYYTLIGTNKLFRFTFDRKDLKLLAISITSILIITETIFILTGYFRTESEINNIYYYESPCISKEKGWLHIWTSDHDLCINNDENCFHRIINNEGLSDINHPLEKSKNEFIILGLGDSFTEGAGVGADSTWLKFLEYSLLKYPLKFKLRLINAGVCGSDPIFEKKLLEKSLIKYKPDLVLLAINNSDIGDILLRGGKERFLANGKTQYSPPPLWEPIYACLHISRLVFHLMGFNELFYKSNRFNDMKAIHIIWESIQEFQELSKKSKFQLVILIHPGNSEIEKGNLDLNPLIDSLSRHQEISYLNLMNYFIRKEGVNKYNSSKYYWDTDGHHNAKGYALFARGVEWKLKEMGIIDSLTDK